VVQKDLPGRFRFGGALAHSSGITGMAPANLRKDTTMADGRIAVTSTELRTTAADMNNAAGSISAEFSRLLNKVTSLSSTWNGQASSNFNSFYTTFNTNWSQCRQALEGISQMLNGSAEAYDQTETAIASRFAQ
jgi:WXG100 family type VII secretion target